MSRLSFVQIVGRYHYFRRNGRRVRLPGAPGSPQYLAAYEKALAGKKPELVTNGRIAFERSSLGWVAEQYLVSGEYRSKAIGTQRAYDVMVKTLRDAPIARALVRDINRQHVNAHC